MLVKIHRGATIFVLFEIALIRLMRHLCVPFDRLFVSLHLDLVKRNHRDPCLLIHRKAEAVVDFGFVPRDRGIAHHVCFFKILL